LTLPYIDATIKLIGKEEFKMPMQKILDEGDPGHEHDMQRKEWDYKRLGPSVTNIDEHDPIIWGYATFHALYGCQCGREGIQIESGYI
jgi:hypothetical protein